MTLKGKPKVVETPIMKFEAALRKAQYSAYQAKKIMGFMNLLRSGPGKTAAERTRRIKFFEMLPRPIQNDIISMTQAWNWAANSKNSISALTASEVRSITQHVHGPNDEIGVPVPAVFDPEGREIATHFFVPRKATDADRLKYTNFPLIMFGSFPGEFKAYRFGGSGYLYQLRVELPGGDFAKWLAQGTKISEPYARNYMSTFLQIQNQVYQQVAELEQAALSRQKRSAVPKKAKK